MAFSQTDIRHIAEFGRKVTKAPVPDLIVLEAFETLKSIAGIETMRVVYSPAPSSWNEWRTGANSVELRHSDEWPAPSRKEFRVLFDPKHNESGFVSVNQRGMKTEAAVQILTPGIWSALLLHSALARVQEASISETELVRETLRARDEERRHIARELHDDLGQSMASLNLRLKWAQEAITEKRSVSKAIDELSAAQTDVGEMLSKIRDLSHTLYPRILDTLGLVSAVKELVHQIAKHSDLEVTCTGHGKERPLRKEVGVGLYRCCQEGINNVLRHANASKLAIDIHFSAKEVRLILEDDGRGFNPRTLYGAGTKLMSSGFWTIRQRMADLGGAFRISTADGHGTVVELIVPYSSRSTNARRKDKTVDRR